MTVLDTHVVIWWLSDSARVTQRARNAIRLAAVAGDLVMSSASVLEIATLVRRERLRLSVGLNEWLEDVQSLSELRIAPITLEIAARAGSFNAEVHGDPIDRLIVATAMSLGVPLVTADKEIRGIKWLTTIW